MPVNRYSFIRIEQLNALAALANSKTALMFGGPYGRPYNFNNPQNPFDDRAPNYRTELARIRVNTLRAFWLFTPKPQYDDPFLYDLYFPYQKSSLISGPWVFTDDTHRPISTGPADNPGSPTTTSDGYKAWYQAPTMTDQKFVAVREAIPAVATTLTLFEDDLMFWSPRVDNMLYHRDDVPDGVPYEFRATLDAAFQFRFELNFIAKVTSGSPDESYFELFGENAAECEIEIFEITTSGSTSFVRATIKTEISTAGPGVFLWEVGVKDATPQKRIEYIQMAGDFGKFVGPNFVEQLNLGRFTNINGTRESYPVIDRLTDGYAIAGVPLANNKITSRFVDANDILIREGRKFIGNQAFMLCEPLGNPKFGVWVGKCFPIASVLIRNQFNPNAPETCEYMLPNYPTLRYNPALPASDYKITSPALDLSGTAIISVCARRRAVSQNQKGVQPGSLPELTVEIGRYNGGFAPFDSVTIPAGANEISKQVLYVAEALFDDRGEQFKLVYKCSQEVNFQTAFIGASPAVGLGQNIGLGKKVFGNVLMTDFYNDTEALLNLL